MICDDLVNFEDYVIFEDEAAEKIAAFIKTLDKNNAVGKYEIDGEKIFAMISNYETRKEGEYEAHREYVDIQLVLLGEEYVYVGSNAGAVQTQEYSPDCEFFKFTPESANCINLHVGNFAVFMPNELHMPNMDSCNGTFSNVKVVVKVHKSLLK